MANVATATRPVVRKCWRQQEFVAHGHNVNCLALGPKFGRILVTGGDDRKVNMWALGKPNVILSLAGHTSPVESVQFNSSEELVVAGSQSGTLKIWDLDAAKIFRTLTGHKSSIKCIDFHPYGDYLTSGSLDTNVKVWDTRRKGCIITYKGHTDAINHIRFSPDGRWIVSAGEDGVSKLWDLTAGKQLSELKHAGSVNNVEFHPKEFLLATGSGDRTVKFWDLEKLCLVSSTDQEANPIRSVAFHPDGQCLFSGSNDSLKIYGWEPVRCFDSFTVGWGKIFDLVVTPEQVIGASFLQTNASIWIADFKNIEEMVSNYDGLQENANKVSPAEVLQGNREAPITREKNTSPQRKVFETKRPTTSCSKPRKPKVDEQPEKKQTTPQKENSADEYNEVFTPRSAIDRTPPPRAPYPVQSVPKEELLQGNIPESGTEPKTETRNEPNSNQEKLAKNNVSEKVCKNIEQKVPKASQVASSLRETQPSTPPPPSPVPAKPGENIQPTRDNDLSQVNARLNDRDIPSAPTISEAEAANVLQKGHTTFSAVMTNRHRNLTIVWTEWKEGNIKGAVQVAIHMNDLSSLVDLLSVLCLKQTLWNLDICSLILPNLKDMLFSRHENYVQTGATVVKVVLRNFGPVVKSNMAAPPVSIGVDLVREERFQKCQTCHAHLMALRSLVETKLSLSGRIGSIYRELSLLFSSLE